MSFPSLGALPAVGGWPSVTAKDVAMLPPTGPQHAGQRQVEGKASELAP